MRGALRPLKPSYDTMSAMASVATVCALRLNVSEKGSPGSLRFRGALWRAEEIAALDRLVLNEIVGASVAR